MLDIKPIFQIETNHKKVTDARFKENVKQKRFLVVFLFHFLLQETNNKKQHKTNKQNNRNKQTTQTIKHTQKKQPQNKKKTQNKRKNLNSKKRFTIENVLLMYIYIKVNVCIYIYIVFYNLICYKYK